MIVAVTSVRVVQMPGHQIIHVVAVRHSVVPAVWSVRVVLGVLAAVVLRRAARRVARVDGEAVIVDVIAVHVVQVAVVKVIRMVAVSHRLMAAPGFVLM